VRRILVFVAGAALIWLAFEAALPRFLSPLARLRLQLAEACEAHAERRADPILELLAPGWRDTPTDATRADLARALWWSFDEARRAAPGAPRRVFRIPPESVQLAPADGTAPPSAGFELESWTTGDERQQSYWRVQFEADLVEDGWRWRFGRTRWRTLEGRADWD
jgi:hypothetical protein